MKVFIFAIVAFALLATGTRGRVPVRWRYQWATMAVGLLIAPGLVFLGLLFADWALHY